MTTTSIHDEEVPQVGANSALTPILPGFHPDPTICKIGKDYFLSTSSFEYFPSSPLFHSTDLVTWNQAGHILDRRTQFRLGDPLPSTGTYAGTLREHDGTSWYITTNVSDYSSGQVLVHSTDPTGDWSDPVFIPEAIGIDPDLCWDDDGACYLSWKAMNFTEGEIGILQSRVDTETGKLLDKPYAIWQGSGLGAVEAPHFYHIGDYWYLLLAEGGTERGHCVTAARSLHPAGPFEPCPSNPIFTHRSSIHEVQNVGHADLVQTPDGGWAAVYLGVRPKGSTPGFHVLGRETFIAGIDWTDGWPVFVEDRFTIPTADTSFVDEFNETPLDAQWVVPGGEAENTVERATDGGIRLKPLADGSDSVLCFRVKDLSWVADASLVDAGSFVLRMDERNAYGITVRGGEANAWAKIGGIHLDLGSSPVLATTTLRIESIPSTSPNVPLGHGGPDEIVLSLVLNSEVHELGRLDGRYLSTEVASGFTGRMLGLQSTPDAGVVQSFRYLPQS